MLYFISTVCKLYSFNWTNAYKYPSTTPFCVVTLSLIAFFVKYKVIPFPTLIWNFTNIPECWCVGTKWNKIPCRSSIFKPDNFRIILNSCANLGEFLAGPAIISKQFSILTENGHLRTKHLLCFVHTIDKGSFIRKENDYQYCMNFNFYRIPVYPWFNFTVKWIWELRGTYFL